MSPPQGPNSVNKSKKEDNPIIKTSKIGKVKTEIRKILPPGPINTVNTNTVKRKYILNRKNQINKLVMKNKMSSPIEVEYKTNSVVIKYSPAVFKEVVKVAMDDMAEEDVFKTNNLVITVKKVRSAEEVSNITVDKLITLEVQSKDTTSPKVPQQIHVYNTTQSVMVQGSRLIKGTKGYKVLVEDFLQPHIESFIHGKEGKIKETKEMLDKALNFKDTMTSKKELSHTCDECNVKFKENNDLVTHKNKMHGKKTQNIKKCVDILSDIIEDIDTKTSHNPDSNQETKSEPKLNKVQEKLAHIIKQIKTPSVKSKEEKAAEEMEPTSLKRSNSTSPSGSKGKNQKTIPSPKPLPKKVSQSVNDKKSNLEDLEEDLKLVKQERDELKVANSNLVEEKEKLRRENSIMKTEQMKLNKKLEKQEQEVLKAMQDIADEVTEERNRLITNVTTESNNKNESDKMKREQEQRYNELKDEKDKVISEMVDIQKERDLLLEKIQTIEKEKKIHKNLKLFKTLVGEGGLTKEEVDECINKVNCEGDCDEVSEAIKLTHMKQAGGQRSCPQTEAKTLFKCDKCDFMSQNKTFFTQHTKQHNEEKRARIIPERDQTQNQRPCSYYRSPQGCKKGNNCNWNHSDNAQAEVVEKVPKLCRNKETCRWKPRCKFIHPEDGESLPGRSRQDQVSVSGPRSSEHHPSQGAAAPARVAATTSTPPPSPPPAQQVFSNPDMASQPPDWNQLPPPTYNSPEKIIQQIQQIQQQIQNVNLMCLKQFPNLGKKQGQ